MMREHFHVAAHSQMFGLLGGGVSQTDSESNPHILGDFEKLENALTPLRIYQAAILVVTGSASSRAVISCTDVSTTPSCQAFM